MKPGKKNSYNSLSDLEINDISYKFYSLAKAEQNGLNGIEKLPKSLKVLLENLLRYEDDLSVTKIQIDSIQEWLKLKKSNTVGLNPDITGLTTCAPKGLVDHDPRMLKAAALAFGSSTEKKRSHTRRQADTDSVHIGLDVLHGVKDAKAVVNGTAG